MAPGPLRRVRALTDWKLRFPTLAIAGTARTLTMACNTLRDGYARNTPHRSADAMAAEVMNYAPATDAEALKLLRARFPDAPLSLRVAALAFLMNKPSRSEVARLMPAIAVIS